MALDGLMFDHLLFNPFEVMVGCVRSKVSVRQNISNDAVMHVVVKGDVSEVI